MAQLIYSMIVSLDGYIAFSNGDIDWAEPDDEVYQFINDFERPVGTYLYGRRMYEAMAVWQTMRTDNQPPFVADFANMWRAADKVVYSTSLGSVSTPKTKLERRFDPAAVRRLKESSTKDLSISGPNLAAHAFEAGLVDACCLFISPILIGGGQRAFPTVPRIALELEDERRFRRGTVFVRYRCRYS